MSEARQELGIGAITEIEQFHLDVKVIIDGLYSLSLLVRTTKSSYDILIKANKIDVTYYHVWDIQHVQQKFPQADPALIEKLGKANSRRRQKFKYLQTHRIKFGLHLEDTNSTNDQNLAYPEASHDKGTQETRTCGSRSQMENTASAKTQTSQTSVTTFIKPVETLDLEDGLSTATSTAYGDFDRNANLGIPDMPIMGTEGRAFECPFCFEIVRAASERSWQ